MSNQEGTLKLDVGCGEHCLPGYVGIDRKQGGDAFPLKLNDGTSVADESVDELRASHILEHASHRIVGAWLAEWIRVLKPGGLLKVAVPNFEYVCRKYLSEEDEPEQVNVLGYVLGGHLDGDDVHGCLFDEGSLAQLLEDAGLVEVEPWESDAQDCSSLPVSLNLQARKPEKKAAAGRQTENPFAWLVPYAANTYSQNGEDGTLAALFGRLGAENRWCIECGAGDGIRYSNTRKLIEEGWNAVLIEKDPAVCLRMGDSLRQSGFTDVADCWPAWKPGQPGSLEHNGKLWPHGLVWRDDTPGRVVITVCAEVTASGDATLDAILTAADCPAEPDLLVLDVDGQEYYLWNSLVRYRPRVVLCEFALGPDPDYIPPLGGEGQAGRDAIMSVAYSKGLRPVAMVGPNLLFVQLPLLPKVCDGPLPDAVKWPTRLRVKAIMSVPRYGPLGTQTCCWQAFGPLGVQLEMVGGVFWGQALTGVMERHLDDGTAFLLTLDMDSMFTRDDVTTLHRLMEEHPEADAVFALEMKRSSETPLLTLVDRAGNPRERVACDEMAQDLVPANTGHFGLTMIRVESLKRLAKPWFLHHPDENGSWGKNRIDEDLHFWAQARAAGWKVYLAPRVVVGHAEEVVTWPDKQLQPLHQNLQDYVLNGKPEGAWA